jgi:hypothetical protein
MIQLEILESGWGIAGVIASFLVAAIALGLGVISYIQTNNIKKRERKERRLNEIIEWARNIIEYDNREVMEGIDRTVDKDNPAMKSLLLSMSENNYFIQFKNTCINVVIPTANNIDHESLISSIISINEDIKTYLDLLGKVQIAMMKEISSGSKQLSKETDELNNRTITYKRDILPLASQKVIKEANKYKLML